MTRAQANRRLRKAFNSLNKLYFKKSLKPPRFLEYGELSRSIDGLQMFLEDGSSHIEINKNMIGKERHVLLTLLHEMVHQKNGPNYKPEHGMLFDAEIHRLYMAGAYDGLL